MLYSSNINKNTRVQDNRKPLVPINPCYNKNRIKSHFEKNMRKPVQSNVVDTLGVDEMLT